MCVWICDAEVYSSVTLEHDTGSSISTMTSTQGDYPPQAEPELMKKGLASFFKRDSALLQAFKLPERDDDKRDAERDSKKKEKREQVLLAFLCLQEDKRTKQGVVWMWFLAILQQIIKNAAAWQQEIIPHWNEKSDAKRTIELAEEGIPPKFRGKVWSLGLGNDLNITEELFLIGMERAKAAWVHLKTRGDSNPLHRSSSETLSAQYVGDLAKHETMEVIALDLTTTFPSLGIFQVRAFEWFFIITIFSS